MAVATGSQIRPELSAVNYAPYLQATGQAAQMMARGSENIAAGLANLGQQAGAAIKDYYAKKESKQLEDDAISLISTKIEKNQSLGDFIGVKRDKDGILDKKALRVAVKTVGVPAILSAAKSLDQEEKLKGLFGETNPPAAATAIQGGASFEQLPTDSAAYKPAPIGFQQLMQRGLAVGMNPSDIAALGNAMTNAREAEIRAQPKPRDPVEILKINAELDKLRSDARLNDANALRAAAQAKAAGQPTPSVSLATEKFNYEKQQDEAKKAEADANMLDRAAYHKTILSTTIDTIDQSLALLKRGAGGTIQGYAPIAAMGAMFGGGESKTLISNIDSIKSAIKIENVMSMKEMSKNGATGFGSLNAQEGNDLANNIAKLDPTLPEEQQIKNLTTIRQTLLKLGSIRDNSAEARKQKQPTLKINSMKKIRD